MTLAYLVVGVAPGMLSSKRLLRDQHRVDTVPDPIATNNVRHGDRGAPDGDFPVFHADHPFFGVEGLRKVAHRLAWKAASVIRSRVLITP